jgi:hypothetical protein
MSQPLHIIFQILKYILYKISGQNHNKSFENVAGFKYLEMTVTNLKIAFTKKLRADYMMGNACYHSVQNLLSSHLLCKNLNIKICKTIILPVV